MGALKSKQLNIARDKNFLFVVLALVCLYIAGSFVYFCAAAGTVRQDVIRLHIIANSDSDFDQQVKLQVRDALLKKNISLLNGHTTKDNAYEHFADCNDELLNTTLETLRSNGCAYGAEISMGQEFYSTRQYGELTFPAGEYTSLRVILGDGKGKNWWCVMFPPLCIPVAGEVKTDESQTADILTPSGESIISSNGKYVVKFKLLEIYEQLKENLK